MRGFIGSAMRRSTSMWGLEYEYTRSVCGQEHGLSPHDHPQRTRLTQGQGAAARAEGPGISKRKSMSELPRGDLTLTLCEGGGLYP